MMNIYIPIADVTLTDGQTYDGQLPVWATRPLMVKVTTGTNEPVNITVRNSGSPVKTVTLPYQQYGIDIDLSFAAPLLKRADRNKSQGTPWFMQQELLFWVDDPTDYITIPVFHCDLTYWDTLGVDAALPQPTKPRIPGQTLDIFFPYIIHPSDALSVQVEPVTGAPSNVIFPTTYVLGDTIDITYIKKLTIKNVWGNGLDQVINYEDRLMSDAIYDTGLQCALRARWNMRNGQWFWGAFKDYFWSNKFTPIRGRGGVTEQAEITINLEYGEEYYNVYQELLVSSNIVFDLNIPGINQYQDKRFRAEVSGDTGARWSNSSKTYRQQVRFKTTELQDNYMFPLAPDQPPTPSIVFSAQFNPWTTGPGLRLDVWNNIYSNAAWEVQSTPSWFSAIVLTGNAGNTYFYGTVPANTGEPRTGNIVLKSKAGSATYTIPVTQQKASISLSPSSLLVGDGYHGGVRITTITANTPWEVISFPEWMYIDPSTGGAGTEDIYANIQANTGGVRSGSVTFRSKVNTSVTKTLHIEQAGATGNISVDTPTFNVDYLTHPVTVDVTSFGNWSVSARDTWITPNVYAGVNGTTTVTLTIADRDDSKDPRTGTITFNNDLTGHIVVVTVNQAGAPTSIGLAPSRISGSKAGGEVRPITYLSYGNWTMRGAPSWVAVSPTSGGSGSDTINVTFDTPNPGAARAGQLRIENMTTHEIGICLITQEG